MHRLIRPRAAVTAAAVLLALGAAACGDDETPQAAASDAGSEGITIRAAEFTWTAASVTTSILAEIAAQHPELGVAKIERTQLDPAPAWAGAQRGDIDLLTEVALPNQQPLADKAKAEVDLLKETYGDAAQGWFVPSYAVEPGGPLEGLETVEQLPEYADALGGKLYDADPGWVSTELNAKRLKGYGLELDHVTSGEAAELAQLKRAYQREEPILLYLYRPHWVFTQYDMTQVREDAPYEEDCFTTGSGACALPPYAAWVAARKDLAERAPRFHKLLTRFEIPLEDVEAMLAQVDLEQQDPEAVAKAWVDEHRDTIATWAR